jgi:hypothetical protein
VPRPLVIGERYQEMSDEDEEEMVDIQEGDGDERSIDTH